jgi:hypothetical protein
MTKDERNHNLKVIWIYGIVGFLVTLLIEYIIIFSMNTSIEVDSNYQVRGIIIETFYHVLPVWGGSCFSYFMAFLFRGYEKKDNYVDIEKMSLQEKAMHIILVYKSIKPEDRENLYLGNKGIPDHFYPKGKL